LKDCYRERISTVKLERKGKIIPFYDYVVGNSLNNERCWIEWVSGVDLLSSHARSVAEKIGDDRSNKER